MKKIIIAIVIIGIIIGIIFLVKPKEENIEEILSKYETVENDGYEENGGYIVSKKTSEG